VQQMIWRPVAGYEGVYSVSDRGLVRRDAPGKGARPGKLLRLARHTYGYHRVTLVVNGIQRKYFVHHLVAEAFIGLRPDGACIHHRDNDKTNNTPNNLEWTTLAANTVYQHRDGLVRHVWGGNVPEPRRGEANNKAKLKEADVREIRTSPEVGYVLAQRFGMSLAGISAIRTGRTWKHLL
jgi:hypothetical protein